MSNANPDTRVFGAFEGIIPHGLVMCVDNPDFRVPGNQVMHEPLIPGKVQGIQPGADKYPSSHLSDLLIVFPGHGFVGQKIKLDLCQIQFSVIVHQHGFNSGPGHVADGMQYSDHLLYSLGVCFHTLMMGSFGIDACELSKPGVRMLRIRPDC